MDRVQRLLRQQVFQLWPPTSAWVIVALLVMLSTVLTMLSFRVANNNAQSQRIHLLVDQTRTIVREQTAERAARTKAVNAATVKACKRVNNVERALITLLDDSIRSAREAGRKISAKDLRRVHRAEAKLKPDPVCAPPIAAKRKPKLGRAAVAD